MCILDYSSLLLSGSIFRTISICLFDPINGESFDNCRLCELVGGGPLLEGEGF